MKILVTGFDPFGGESINPAWEAVRTIPDTVKGAAVAKLEIPTVFQKGAAAIVRALEEIQPDAVLSVGQAGGRSALTVEFVGINWADARIPDNEGGRPIGETIHEDGETAYFSTLPVHAMVDRIRRAGLPAHLSYSAGTYVCNEVMYSVAYYIAKHRLPVRSGFLHVPLAPEQTIVKPNGTPSMNVADMTRGIVCALEAIVEHEEDIRIGMGQTE